MLLTLSDCSLCDFLHIKIILLPLHSAAFAFLAAEFFVVLKFLFTKSLKSSATPLVSDVGKTYISEQKKTLAVSGAVSTFS